MVETTANQHAAANAVLANVTLSCSHTRKCTVLQPCQKVRKKERESVDINRSQLSIFGH